MGNVKLEKLEYSCMNGFLLERVSLSGKFRLAIKNREQQERQKRQDDCSSWPTHKTFSSSFCRCLLCKYEKIAGYYMKTRCQVGLDSTAVRVCRQFKIFGARLTTSQAVMSFSLSLNIIL